MHFESAKDKSVYCWSKKKDEPSMHFESAKDKSVYCWTKNKTSQVCTLNRQRTKTFTAGQKTRQAQCVSTLWFLPANYCWQPPTYTHINIFCGNNSAWSNSSYGPTKKQDGVSDWRCLCLDACYNKHFCLVYIIEQFTAMALSSETHTRTHASARARAQTHGLRV